MHKPLHGAVEKISRIGTHSIFTTYEIELLLLNLQRWKFREKTEIN